jgi:hypothetical protein
MLIFYYQNLFLAKSIYFINKNLALYRHNRPDASSNYDNNECAIFYLTVKGFKQAYTKEYHQPLIIKRQNKNNIFIKNSFCTSLFIC